MSVHPRFRWWGGRAHVIFTIVVLTVLASLDNAVIGVIPPLYGVIANDLGVSIARVGFVTASTILVVAFSALLWGFWGDQGGRKRLLFYGTLIWSAAALMTANADSYASFLLWQVVAATGMGSIASVGFSVISDFVSPRRRGIVMSLWGVSQGLGTIAGATLGGLLGAQDWRAPLAAVAIGGLVFAMLYLLTYEPERGRAEPNLSEVFQSGGRYRHRIDASDLVALVRKPSNVWLIAQGLTAQFAYGSLIWLPVLLASKVEADGHSVEAATMVGALFASLFQVGGLFAIVGGHLGDRWQRRTPRGRALLSAIGILGAVPFYLALFSLPLRGLEIVEGGGAGAAVWAVAGSLFSNGWVVASLALALTALALTSIDSPNWYALIGDVNLPEHRGTVFGMGLLVSWVGRAAGNGLTGIAFAFFSTQFGLPLGYVIGLAAFQLFFIPTGLFYLMAARATPADIAGVQATLALRGAVNPEPNGERTDMAVQAV